MRKIVRYLAFYSRSKKIKKEVGLLEKLLRGSRLHLCDVGAAGGLEPRWEGLEDYLHITSFEPDGRSDVLNRENVDFYPKAVWSSEQEIVVNLTKKPKCSSVFRPNRDYLDLFSESSRFDVEKQVSMSAITLDSTFRRENPFDFIKLDVQGGELNILKGASDSLEEVLGLELEVEFKTSYIDQPLFADVLKFCESKSFVFIDFVNMVRWERKQSRGLGELNFGDALFLRYPEKIAEDFNEKKIDESKIRKYAAILFLYRRYDLLDRLLDLLETQIGDLQDLRVCRDYLCKDLKKIHSISHFFHKLINLSFKNVRLMALY